MLNYTTNVISMLISAYEHFLFSCCLFEHTCGMCMQHSAHTNTQIYIIKAVNHAEHFIQKNKEVKLFLWLIAVQQHVLCSVFQFM